MIDIFDDLDFLGFVKQKLEGEIDFQEKLIENQRNNFFDKQLDFELHKELYRLYIWKNRIQEYIQNKMADDNPNMNMKELLERNQALLEQNQKLLKSNKELVERIEELKLEVNLLNNDIKRFTWKLYNLT